MKNDDELMLVDKYAAKPLLYFFFIYTSFNNIIYRIFLFYR